MMVAVLLIIGPTVIGPIAGVDKIVPQPEGAYAECRQYKTQESEKLDHLMRRVMEEAGADPKYIAIVYAADGTVLYGAAGGDVSMRVIPVPDGCVGR